MTTSGLPHAGNGNPDEEAGELPAGYGETMAAMLPRDHHWMFIYWEIAAAEKDRVAREYGPDAYKEFRQTLRVYDAASVNGGGGGSPRHFDIPVMFEARSWYINVPDPGRAYYAELGLLAPGGTFIGLVKSNTVTLPPGRVSDKVDGNWLTVSEDLDRLLQLSGIEYIGKGSGEVARSLAQRWEMLQAVFSRGASWGVSSLAAQEQQQPAAKQFRLLADCELIVYGATEPGAFATICGRKLDLNPDGTFSLRFALPDGETDLDIRAMPADETDSRQVSIKISRLTE